MTENRSVDPDYLPARMLNEFVYCPRLFYYEHVEGVFVPSSDTVEGSQIHARVDTKTDALPEPRELLETDREIRSRSVMLSSERHKLIAKMDVLEARDGMVVPVDYKRGAPRKLHDGSISAWDPDRIQLGVQALILREHGYACKEAVVYYAKTRQRVRIPVDEGLMRETLEVAERARAAIEGSIPPPLVDSPKCPRCSLVGICLPDETERLQKRRASQRWIQKTLFDVAEYGISSEPPEEVSEPVRRLVPARDDRRPLYLDTQGLYVGKSGRVLKVKEGGRVVQEVRVADINLVNLMGNIQISTQAVQMLCSEDIPIAYFSQGGWFYGITEGMGLRNVMLRREQFRLAEVAWFCRRFASALVAGKIRNCRTMLQRNHKEPPRKVLSLLKCFEEDARRASDLETLRGIEGTAARVYFEHFAGMIKVGDRDESIVGVASDLPSGDAGDVENGSDQGGNGFMHTFDFRGRNRRPPKDPTNALLSLAYSMLVKDLTIVCRAVGLDPHLGLYHQMRPGRPSLALDLMEPFRPVIADSAVLSAINTRMVTEKHFVRTGTAVSLTPKGRKQFYRAYEQRMDTLVTHPVFGYRVNYRRIIEIQVRLLGRFLMAEIPSYSVFTTR